MPRFQYHAVDQNGKTKNGEYKAQDRSALLEHLRGQGLTALSIEELSDDAGPSQTKKKEEKDLGSTQVSLSVGISRKDITVFTRQLATTLMAGLPLLRIIHVLHRESTNRKLKGILEGLGQSLQKGSRFSAGLAEHKGVFDEMYINMVRVGELGGSLPECMSRLAMMLEKEMTMRRKVKAAMAYPGFILLFTSLMTYALVAFMMPMFSPMFADSGLNIERDYPMTHWLMKASEVATDPYKMGAIVASIVAVFVAYRVMVATPAGLLAVDTIKFHFPFVQELIRKIVAARFARNFSLLLKSGVPLIEALNLVAGSSGNQLVATKLRKVGRNIQEGDAISKTLRLSGLFPDMLIQMATMGEEAGSLPDMLERVADYYDEEVDAGVAAMTALLEPAMMVIIGGVVGMFVMGVLLPILGISSGYQEQL